MKTIGIIVLCLCVMGCETSRSIPHYGDVACIG